jgi:hypothetical protein
MGYDAVYVASEPMGLQATVGHPTARQPIGPPEPIFWKNAPSPIMNTNP